MDPDKWHHVAVVYDASGRTAHLYVDGTEESSVGVNTIGSSQGPLHIGDGYNINNFTGLMDELMIFKAALDLEDVKSLFKAGGGNPLPLSGPRKTR